MVKNYDDMLSCFHLIPERYGQIDGQTDGQTDRFAISISRVSTLTRDENRHVTKPSINQLWPVALTVHGDNGSYEVRISGQTIFLASVTFGANYHQYIINTFFAGIINKKL